MVDKQIESYHISKSEYGIIELLINTRDKWVDFTDSSNIESFLFFIYTKEEFHPTKTDRLIIPLAEFNFDKEKEYNYLELHQQEKDQIIYYWIPYRLLKGDAYIEKLKQSRDERSKTT